VREKAPEPVRYGIGKAYRDQQYPAPVRRALSVYGQGFYSKNAQHKGAVRMAEESKPMEPTGEEFVRMLEEMYKMGWEITLAGWKEKDPRWLCDAQIGVLITDPEFTAESPRMKIAVQQVYDEWKYRNKEWDKPRQ
jgi:hypothetical protein